MIMPHKRYAARNEPTDGECRFEHVEFTFMG